MNASATTRDGWETAEVCFTDFWEMGSPEARAEYFRRRKIPFGDTSYLFEMIANHEKGYYEYRWRKKTDYLESKIKNGVLTRNWG